MKKITREKYSEFSGYAKRLITYMDRRDGGVYSRRIIAERTRIPFDELDRTFRELQRAGLFEVENVNTQTVRVIEL